MNVKNNLRTQNTQNKIKEVFIELLGGKPINKITIQDICRKADVNRTTFYTHFSDIYDLMKKIEIEKMQKILSLIHDTEQTGHILNEKTIEKLLDFTLENSSFYKIYLNDFNICQTIDSLIEDSHNENLPPTKCEFYYEVEFIKAGMMGVIRTWLNTDCKESPKELAQILYKCLPKF